MGMGDRAPLPAQGLGGWGTFSGGFPGRRAGQALSGQGFLFPGVVCFQRKLFIRTEAPRGRPGQECVGIPRGAS